MSEVTEQKQNPLLNIVLIDRIALYAAKNVFHSFRLGTKVTKTFMEAFFVYPGAGISAQMENFVRLEKEEKEQYALERKQLLEEHEEKLRQIQQTAKNNVAALHLNPMSAAHAVAQAQAAAAAAQSSLMIVSENQRIDLGAATAQYVMNDIKGLNPPKAEKPLYDELDFETGLVSQPSASSKRGLSSKTSFPHLLDRFLLSDSSWGLDLILMFNTRLKKLMFEYPLSEEVCSAELFKNIGGTSLPCFSPGNVQTPLMCWPLLHVAIVLNAKNIVMSLLNNLKDYCNSIDEAEGGGKRGEEIFENYINLHIDSNHACFFAGPVRTVLGVPSATNPALGSTIVRKMFSNHRWFDFTGLEKRQMPGFTPLQLAVIVGNPTIIDFLLKRGHANVFEVTQTRLGKKNPSFGDAFEILINDAFSSTHSADVAKTIFKYLASLEEGSNLKNKVMMQCAEKFKQLDPNQSYLCNLIRRQQTSMIKMILSKFDIYCQFFEPRFLVVAAASSSGAGSCPQNIVWKAPNPDDESNNDESNKAEAKNDDDDDDTKDAAAAEMVTATSTSSSKLSLANNKKYTPKEPHGPWSTSPLLTAIKSEENSANGAEIFSLLVKSKYFNLDGEPFTSFSQQQQQSITSSSSPSLKFKTPTPLMFLLQGKLLRLHHQVSRLNAKKDEKDIKNLNKKIEGLVQGYLVPLLESGVSVLTPSDIFDEQPSSDHQSSKGSHNNIKSNNKNNDKNTAKGKKGGSSSNDKNKNKKGGNANDDNDDQQQQAEAMLSKDGKITPHGFVQLNSTSLPDIVVEKINKAYSLERGASTSGGGHGNNSSNNKKKK